MTSKPINIPIITNMKKNNKKISHSPSSSSSLSTSYSASVSASFTPNQTVISTSYDSKNNMKSIILYGAPFTNKETVSILLQDCVNISKDTADKVIAEVEKNKYAKIITCDVMKANIYCKNLVDNGLCVLLE